MPLKNQFLTGISSRHNKTSNQNELKPFTSLSFTGDCTVDFLGKESYHRITTNSTGTELVYNISTKGGSKLILCTRDFNSIGFDFEIETAKSNKHLLRFTS
jgi:hypothetical protein